MAEVASSGTRGVSPHQPTRSGVPAGCVHEYSRDEEGRTDVTWVPGSCTYGKDVSSQRRGQHLCGSSSAGDMWPLLAKRVHEVILDNPVCPLARTEMLLDTATGAILPDPRGMDPDHAGFAKAAFEYVRALLLESNRVHIHAQRRIGQFLDTVTERSTSTMASLSGIQQIVCNQSSREKVAYYQRIRDECSLSGCLLCRAAKEFSSAGATSRQPLSCKLTQRVCRLKDYEFQNLTPVFLEGCRKLAKLPDCSPLLRCSYPRGQLRRLVGEFEDMQGVLVTRGLPGIVAGCGHMFALGQGESAAVAIQDVNEDGGYIVAEKFPGLHGYVTEVGHCPPPLQLAAHGYNLLPFREQHHDAIELGHEYVVRAEHSDGSQRQTHGPGSLPLGYDALVAARENLSRATKLWVVPSSLDRSGERLLVEIFTLEPSEQLPKATGVRLLETGLSYLVGCAPPAYEQAWAHSTRGVHLPSLHGLANCDALSPRELKHAFASSQSEVEEEWTAGGAQVSCAVSNTTSNLNEANLLILESRIAGAGLGLFLRPTPPSTNRALVIPRDERICLYSRRPIDSSSVADLTSTDYLVEVQIGSHPRYFNPDVFTGEEMGRYANQGGLLEGLRELCRACDRASGHESFSHRGVKEVIAPKCNVKFRPFRNSLHLCACVGLRSNTDAQELLVDYNIDYWVRYVVDHIHTMDTNSNLAKYVLWVLLSDNSAYSGDQELVERVPGRLCQLYAHMPCPVTQSMQRRRR